MDNDGFIQNVKRLLGGGRWAWILATVLLVVVIAIPAALLWPVLRPKPEVQYMPVPQSSIEQSQAPAATLPSTVPDDVKQAIAFELGVEESASLSMHYQGDTKHVVVTEAVGANDFKTYMFVQGEDGTWSEQ